MDRCITVAMMLLWFLVLQTPCARLKPRKVFHTGMEFSKQVRQKRDLARNHLHNTNKAKVSKDVRHEVQHNSSGHHSPSVPEETHEQIQWKFRWKWSNQGLLPRIAGRFADKWKTSKLSGEDMINQLNDLKENSSDGESDNDELVDDSEERKVTIEPDPYGNKFHGSIEEAIDWIRSICEVSVSRCAVGGGNCQCQGKVYFGDRYSGPTEMAYDEMLLHGHRWRYVVGSTACSNEGIIGNKTQFLNVVAPKQCFCDPRPFLEFALTAHNRYTVHLELGRGGFGIIVLATDVWTNEKVVVKFIPFESQDDDSREFELQREAASAYVPRIHEELHVGGHSFYIMDVAPGMNLQNYLDDVNFVNDEDTARSIFAQVAMAVQGCHRNKIVHRDIKPDNIRYRPNMDYDLASSPPQTSIMLLDFGLAAKISRRGRRELTTKCGTNDYEPPQALSEDRPYGTDFDIWSMGVLLYELVSGKLPFKGNTDEEILASIKQNFEGTDEFQFPDGWESKSPQLKHLIKKMLTIEQDGRVDIDGVLNDPWVTNTKRVARKSKTVVCPGIGCF